MAASANLDTALTTPFTIRVRLYGLLDHGLREVIEFYPSREAAERELAEILADEPGWVEKLEIVLVDFSGAEAAVTSASAG